MPNLLLAVIAAAAALASLTGAEVTYFSLVNADTNRFIRALKDGDVIDTPSFSVYAYVDQLHRTARVRFYIDGVAGNVESAAPFAIAGDYAHGDARPWRRAAGPVHIRAVQELLGGGAAERTIRVIVAARAARGASAADPRKRPKLRVHNPRTGRDDGRLLDGRVATLRTFSIRADAAASATPKVVFYVNGAASRTESVAPYEIGAARAWAWPQGRVALRAVQHRAAAARERRRWRSAWRGSGGGASWRRPARAG